MRLYRLQHHISPNTSSATSTSSRYALTAVPFLALAPEEETPLPAAWVEAPSKAPAATIAARATTATTVTTATTASQQPTAHSQQLTSTAAPEGARGESSRRPFGYAVVLVVSVVVVLVFVLMLVGADLGKTFSASAALPIMRHYAVDDSSL